MSTKLLISLPFESIEDFDQHQKELMTKVVKGLNNTKEPGQEYLTRKEVAQLLKISLVTLNEWSKKGIIQSYRIGNRVRFRKTDVDAALKEVHNLKYRR